MSTIAEAWRHAQKLHRSGQLQQATLLYQQIIDFDPQHAGAWHLLGVAACQLTNYQMAADCLNCAVGFAPNSAEVYSDLGVVYRRSQRLDEAVACYRRALELKPDSPEIYNNLGLALCLQRKPDEAVACYRRALDLRPGCAGMRHSLGAALWELGERNEAVAYWRQALELQPDFPEALNDLGVALRELGQLDEAVTCYQRALTQNPDYVDAYNNLGNVWQELGKQDAAATCFRRALELDATCSAAHNNLGNLLHEQGELEGAVASYRRALAVQSDHTEALSNLGKSLYRLGRISESVEVWRQWLEYDPDNPVASHMLAALTGQDVPSRASDEYVRNTFDSFARTFEQQLLRLEYHAPDLIAAATAKALGDPAGNLDVLDAGCGTGLCGPQLRPFARRLTGVDLSAGMIHKAHARQLYDDLITAELTLHLAGTEEQYDLVVSADTLVYFGDLKPVLTAAAHAIRPRGFLIFTLEQADPGTPDTPGFHLQQHGRYSHTERFVRDTLAEVGLCLHDLARGILRTEQGHPVHGLLVSACNTL